MAGGKPFGTDWGFWILGAFTIFIFLQGAVMTDDIHAINERLAAIHIQVGPHVDIQRVLDLVRIMNEYSDLTKENRNLLINIINQNFNDLPTDKTFRILCEALSTNKGHGDIGNMIGDLFPFQKPPGGGFVG